MSGVYIQGFVVGPATAIFERSVAEKLMSDMKHIFGLTIPTYDAEVDFSDCDSRHWVQLQERAGEEIGARNLEHLLSVNEETWFAVYLPINVEPTKIPMPARPEEFLLKRLLKGQPKLLPYPPEIKCMSLFELKKELEMFATKLNLTIEVNELKTLKQSLRGRVLGYESPDASREDEEVFTYAELMLAAKFAIEHNYPLWLI